MTEENALARILLGLGNTADAVAATLKTNQVQGVRNTVRFFNPIVRYAQHELQVDLSTLDVIQPDTLRMTLPDRAEEAGLPQAVKEFLDAFNRGDYPELELPANGA